MADEKDFFGEIGDFFGGIFDTAENAITRLISLEELRRTQQLLGGVNVPTPFQAVAPLPPATGTGTGTATGVGPFAGVPVEVMVMIVGATLVALVLLRR